MVKHLRALNKGWTFLLICFCSYTFLVSLSKVLEGSFIRIELLNPVLLQVLQISLAIILGWVVQYELKEYLGEDWKKCGGKEPIIEKVMVEFLYFSGIVALYFGTQLGLMVLFFPNFSYTMYHGFHLFNGVFGAVAIIMYGCYRLTLFKWV
ncbi:hypothetical protein U8V72_15295 [Priestia filamentosa]|uniref:hypothetical protein n=1 Tax=Priestia filamentosa TaxID=1402861 RepID=UPI000588FB08